MIYRNTMPLPNVFNINLRVEEHKLILCSGVKFCYENAKLIDLIFICNHHIQVRTHKIILSSVSDFLKNVLLSHDQDICYVSIPDIESAHLELLLNLLLNGEIVVKLEDVVYLKQLTNFFSIRCLQELLDAFESYSNEIDGNNATDWKDSSHSQDFAPLLDSTGDNNDAVFNCLPGIFTISDVKSHADADIEVNQNVENIFDIMPDTSPVMSNHVLDFPVTSKMPCVIEEGTTIQALPSVTAENGETSAHTIENHDHDVSNSIFKTVSEYIDSIDNEEPSNSENIPGPKTGAKGIGKYVRKQKFKVKTRLSHPKRGSQMLKKSDDRVSRNQKMSQVLKEDSMDIVKAESVDQCYDVLNTKRNYINSTKRLERPSKAVARLRIADTMNSLPTSSGIDADILPNPNDYVECKEDTLPNFPAQNMEAIDTSCVKKSSKLKIQKESKTPFSKSSEVLQGNLEPVLQISKLKILKSPGGRLQTDPSISTRNHETPGIEIENYKEENRDNIISISDANECIKKVKPDAKKRKFAETNSIGSGEVLAGNANIPRNGRKPKRILSILTRKNIRVLEEEFNKCSTPSTSVQKELALKLGVPILSVSTWFNNRQCREALGMCSVEKSLEECHTLQMSPNIEQSDTSKCFVTMNGSVDKNEDSLSADNIPSEDKNHATRDQQDDTENLLKINQSAGGITPDILIPEESSDKCSTLQISSETEKSNTPATFGNMDGCVDKNEDSISTDLIVGQDKTYTDRNQQDDTEELMEIIRSAGSITPVAMHNPFKNFYKPKIRVFSDEMNRVMQNIYRKNRSPPVKVLDVLAKLFQVKRKFVNIWFHHWRHRELVARNLPTKSIKILKVLRSFPPVSDSFFDDECISSNEENSSKSRSKKMENNICETEVQAGQDFAKSLALPTAPENNKSLVLLETNKGTDAAEKNILESEMIYENQTINQEILDKTDVPQDVSKGSEHSLTAIECETKRTNTIDTPAQNATTNDTKQLTPFPSINRESFIDNGYNGNKEKEVNEKEGNDCEAEVESEKDLAESTDLATESVDNVDSATGQSLLPSEAGNSPTSGIGRAEKYYKVLESSILNYMRNSSKPVAVRHLARSIRKRTRQQYFPKCASVAIEKVLMDLESRNIIQCTKKISGPKMWQITSYPTVENRDVSSKANEADTVRRMSDEAETIFENETIDQDIIEENSVSDELKDNLLGGKKTKIIEIIDITDSTPVNKETSISSDTNEETDTVRSKTFENKTKFENETIDQCILEEKCTLQNVPDESEDNLVGKNKTKIIDIISVPGDESISFLEPGLTLIPHIPQVPVNTIAATQILQMPHIQLAGQGSQERNSSQGKASRATLMPETNFLCNLQTLTAGVPVKFQHMQTPHFMNTRQLTPQDSVTMSHTINRKRGAKESPSTGIADTASQSGIACQKKKKNIEQEWLVNSNSSSKNGISSARSSCTVSSAQAMLPQSPHSFGNTLVSIPKQVPASSQLLSVQVKTYRPMKPCPPAIPISSILEDSTGNLSKNSSVPHNLKETHGCSTPVKIFKTPEIIIKEEPKE